MRLSINWLRQFVDVKESPQELADMLTMLGFEAEIALDLSNLKKVVTAQVESVEKHQNADKLSLCQVYEGFSEDGSRGLGAPVDGLERNEANHILWQHVQEVP